MAIPAGTQVLRFLPPLNLRKTEAEEGLEILGEVVAGLST
jgi:acetylornithine/succinyldiaminopimelate/putrescine aminotransferase